MANFKVVVSDPKSRKAYQKEVEQAGSGMLDRKVGEKLSGDSIGLQGYELEITGGSDKQGFPMRPDVDGIARKKILLTLPPGFHPGTKGERKRKSVRGNTVSAQTSQVNTKVVKYGTKSLDELFGKKEKKEEKAEAKPEEAKKEEKKEEPKAEAPKEEKPAEKTPEAKPAEEAKAEEKAAEEKPAEEKPEKSPEEKMGVKPLEEVEKKEEKAE